MPEAEAEAAELAAAEEEEEAERPAQDRALKLMCTVSGDEVVRLRGVASDHAECIEKTIRSAWTGVQCTSLLALNSNSLCSPSN